MHAIKISKEATDNPNEEDYQSMLRIKQHLDSIRFMKKGAVYYDRQMGRSIYRDGDSSGQLTDRRAKDTLDNLPRYE